jgi:hypothetical protein
MALIKNLDSTYGIAASYHRVTCVSINAISREVTICVASYISKEKRDAGFEFIDSIDITVPPEDYEKFVGGNSFSASYSWLKENIEGFEDAEDD